MIKKKDNLYAILSAVAFIVALLMLIYELGSSYGFIDRYGNFRQDFWQMYLENGKVVSWICEIITLLLLAVAMLIRRKNVLLVIAAATKLLVEIDKVNFNLIILASKLLSIACLLSAIISFVLVAVNCIKKLRDKTRITKIMWVVPGAILLTGLVIDILSTLFKTDADKLGIILEIMIRHYSEELFTAIAYIFMGLWFKKTMPALPDAAVTQTKGMIGGADKLMKYRELLDAGAISQEEFEAKKKEILGI